jgi:hypothetical protein
VALTDALKTNTSVTTINLGGNNIGPVGKRAISQLQRTVRVDVQF